MEKLESTNGDHSDSDSGESWIMLENNSFSENHQDFPDVPLKEEDFTNNTEKDDDTDGISIISESDPEPCELLDTYENIPKINIIEVPDEIHVTTDLKTDSENTDDEVLEDLIGDSTGKMKTYVHKRNKKLSTILNMIVLVSVLITAGVAIGHIWGVRDDCACASSSMNKVLSNLYKLQEENALLKYRIKELALLTGIQNFKRKGDFDKAFPLQQKCRKVFEESLSNKNVKHTKCVDSDMWSDYIDQATFGKNNLMDPNKLRMLYKQNKSRLDLEASKDPMNDLIEKNNNVIEANKWIAQMKLKYDKQKPSKNNYVVFDTMPNKDIKGNEDNGNKNIADTNVDKPKVDVSSGYPSELYKNNIDEILKDNLLVKKENNIIELKKKTKNIEKKKRNNKPKKDKNKFILNKNNDNEERKLKGEIGYDDLNLNDKKYLNEVKMHKKKSKLIKRANKYMTNDDDAKTTLETEFDFISDTKKNKKEAEIQTDSWYEKRAKYRMESRNKVIGEYNLDNADWYFRRMHKREQCRAKSDNSSSLKVKSKNMFKTKK